MILRRRIEHPIPKVPPNVGPTFRNMCAVLSVEEAQTLLELVDQTVEKLREEMERHPRIDIKRAEDIASRCRLLLEHYQEFSTQEKSLVIGAARYFVLPDDPFSDEDFATGLDDDAMVINHVLEQLGIEGMFIEIE